MLLEHYMIQRACSFPMPTNCVSTDQEGLSKTITSFDDSELLIRDSKSTFMKEKVHPKWIRYAKDHC